MPYSSGLLELKIYELLYGHIFITRRRSEKFDGDEDGKWVQAKHSHAISRLQLVEQTEVATFDSESDARKKLFFERVGEWEKFRSESTTTIRPSVHCVES